MTEPVLLSPTPPPYFEKDDFFKKEYDLLPSSLIKIKYTGAADLTNFYKYTKYWLEDNGFVNERNEAMLETRYSERTNPDGSKTTEFRWETYKDNDSFFRYKVGIFFFIMNAKDVEVQWGDVKRNLTKAIFEIRMSGSLLLDPEDKLKDYNFIKRWYYRNVMRKALNYHKAYWFNKLYELQEAMKKFLKENSF
ncbi:hypothetical protein J4405_06160 [Candidatus Woesearchaeota archaeon]|nr:hypothetical protein [Candidatus Woesearchaeota archaeon]